MAVKFIPKTEQLKEEKTYKIGDVFKRDNAIVQLQSVGGTLVQPSLLLSGSRWNRAIPVSDLSNITEHQLELILGAYCNEFTQINVTITED